MATDLRPPPVGVGRGAWLRAALLGTALGLASPGAPALAHVDLDMSNPPHRGVLAQPPAELRLLFTGAVQVTSLRLIESGGESIPLRRVGGTGPATEVRAVPSAPITPGEWKIEWRSVAPDGHVMRGEVEFRVGGAGAR